jgi:hypothetical protein
MQEIHTNDWSEELQERYQLKDLDIDGGDSKLDLKK